MFKKYRWLLIISSVAILLPIVFGLIVWNQLPRQMVIHWGISGEADGWTTTAVAVFVLPIVMLALQWIFVVISFLDKKSRQQTERAMKIVLWIIPAISVFSSAVIYATAFGLKFDIFRFIALIIGIFFVFIGNYLPKFSRNRTAGIKIIWALRSDDNWNKTHRFGGKVWVVCGFLFVVCFFLPETVMYYFMMAIFAVALIAPIIYSYCYYRKQLKSGEVEKEKFKASRLISPILLVLVLVVAIVFCLSGDIVYTVGDDALIIDPSYEGEKSVKYEEIDCIEYRESGVDGSRVFGFGSFKLLLGTFNNEEFGNYARYTYYGDNACIIITIDESKLVIGCEDNESTKSLYDSLVEKGISVEVK